jgi:hypothetical protein
MTFQLGHCALDVRDQATASFTESSDAFLGLLAKIDDERRSNLIRSVVRGFIDLFSHDNSLTSQGLRDDQERLGHDSSQVELEFNNPVKCSGDGVCSAAFHRGRMV